MAPAINPIAGRAANADEERRGLAPASSDVVSISAEARRLGVEPSSNLSGEADATGAADAELGTANGTGAANAEWGTANGTGAANAEVGTANGTSQAAAATPVTTTPKTNQLSAEDQTKVKELKQRDRAVRAHEQAHKAVGGSLAGAVHLSLEQGPDGQSYAVEGSVPIDVTPVKDDPAATIRKMQQVQAAAMAPADPSGADQQVAATAAAQMANAMQELAKKRASWANGQQATAPGSNRHFTA